MWQRVEVIVKSSYSLYFAQVSYRCRKSCKIVAVNVKRNQAGARSNVGWQTVQSVHKQFQGCQFLELPYSRRKSAEGRMADFQFDKLCQAVKNRRDKKNGEICQSQFGDSSP